MRKVQYEDELTRLTEKSLQRYKQMMGLRSHCSVIVRPKAFMARTQCSIFGGLNSGRTLPD
jgi:hypothetical protein